MNDRAFRLDFFIAICALLVSAITAGASAYQTWIIGQQFGASVWPYLSTDTTFTAHGVEVALVNDGLGPALVRSAQLYIDGNPVPSWKQFFLTISRDPIVKTHVQRRTASARATSIDASTIVRAGESKNLLALNIDAASLSSVLARHQLRLEFCYCSLNDRCWTLRATPGKSTNDVPQQVAHCEIGSKIDTGF